MFTDMMINPQGRSKSLTSRPPWNGVGSCV
nr:MAG TPA: hypothetical protein [Bacteriophage sp.]